MTEQAEKRRVIVVGGGAGGLAAAVAAARAGADVAVLERANRVGKKLLLTGNGRCNLSNRHITPGAYNHPDFVRPVLSRTDCAALRAFFEELGLWTVHDGEGRVYPRSDTATSVLDVLRLESARLGVREICSAEVTALERTEGGYGVLLRSGVRFPADAVIFAAGGGTALLAPLGYKMVPFSPVLCPLRTDTGPIRGLSGLRVKCRGRLLEGEQTVDTETGELLFRDYGVSGIMAMDLSRYARRGQVLSLDLAPEYKEDELLRRLREREAPARPAEEFLTGIFHRRVGGAVLQYAGSAAPEALAQAIRDFRLAVFGPGDASMAQVTRGGADVRQFDPGTLESLLHPGLYMVGEALDIDGRCGGFNLHWAFASGLTAGGHAAHG